MVKPKADTSSIVVEVGYARSAADQKILRIQVSPDTTLKTAILQSGILTHYPEIDLSQQKVGIFSQITPLNQSVKAGDRIEIYRPLIIDPKTARRLRAAKKNGLTSKSLKKIT